MESNNKVVHIFILPERNVSSDMAPRFTNSVRLRLPLQANLLLCSASKHKVQEVGKNPKLNTLYTFSKTLSVPWTHGRLHDFLPHPGHVYFTASRLQTLHLTPFLFPELPDLPGTSPLCACAKSSMTVPPLLLSSSPNILYESLTFSLFLLVECFYDFNWTLSQAFSPASPMAFVSLCPKTTRCTPRYAQ